MNAPTTSIPSYQRNLRYLVTVVRLDNAKLILGNQPNLYGTDVKYENVLGVNWCGKYRLPLDSQKRATDAFNAATKKVALENDVPFLDLESHLPKTPGYFFDDIHWTEKGHRVIAEKLYQFIVSGGYIQE
jgi:lysophospholipase L1-like esterase